MSLDIIQSLILGAVQGVTEWLPISSSAALVLIMSNFFGITEIPELLTISLYFHLGTFFAALIYFRKDVLMLFRTLFKYKDSSPSQKKILRFIIVTTIISGIFGSIVLQSISSVELEFTGKGISLAIGVLLLFTGIIQLKSKSIDLRKASDIEKNDGVVLGIVQGISTLPGISRSGITISALLLKKFNDTTALKLSFLMSLPIVLIGNIVLNLNSFIFSQTMIYGLITSFIFGLLTISLLMNLSRKINFGWFVIIFAVLMMISVII